ncbi:putative Solute carrier family 35 member F4 [Hypsibius exemplaris]|uniref:Solute carrier family 35 member F4 n=1 Tax=Hypsibius exemplaris TaxID=2072580 RepID=A0A1W0XBR4_HYPEX|nr:putative Solute carrier family 35 member F4 [Hypsibius exemplaris]
MVRDTTSGEAADRDDNAKMGESSALLQPKAQIEPDIVLPISDADKAPVGWKKCQYWTIAISILVYNTIMGVAEHQIAKEVNSLTFSAPFFLLWYMGTVRALTFPAYLFFRLVHDVSRSRTLSSRDTPYRDESADSSESIWSLILTNVQKIYRESEIIFGPCGLTLKSAAIYLIPFALLWTCTNGFFYWAVTFAEVSECTAVSSLTIIFVQMISWIFLREKLVLFKLLGAVVCITGVVLTVWASGTSFSASDNSLIAAGLVITSSISLAIQTVGFKRYMGSPTVCQIALYQSLVAVTSLLLTWPLFLSLKLTGNEVWEFDTARFGLMSLAGGLSASGALAYYIGISVVSPLFVSLTKPMYIVVNNGVDIGMKGIHFGLYHGFGAGLVIIGFLMLLAPNAWVSLEIRALVNRLRPGRKHPEKEDEILAI